MPYRLVVFDDDENQARSLAELAGEVARSSEFTVETITSASELCSSLAQDSIDILLMDIKIEGMQQNGIDLIRNYSPSRSCIQVIFVTGFDTYHSSVYRARHTWFLMKPVVPAQLEEALGAASENLAASAEKPIVIHSPLRDKSIIPRRIRYAESRGRKIILHVGDEVIEAYAKLSDLCEMLPEGFVQCHKSFVVNMDYIDTLEKDEITLVSGERVPVSQRRRSSVREEFFRFTTRQLAGTA